ncbi:hypothetical protein [Sphingopyxis sp.]|uniref:hypothetical protein n=1 Tax=Sphingopyxis sp. TaxID=1908224 RepID=UPI002D77B24F|nr:hypothetical protein [Sphingopyxis sp.]HET6526174.1 hypothetical protein [Sphingopyxis sp.]
MEFNARLAAPVARDTLAKIRSDAATFTIIYGISVVAGVGYDVGLTRYPDAFVGVQFAFMAANLVLQAWATLTILRMAGVELPQQTSLRIASVFGVGLLFGLGVGLGLLLLILPGIYLAARWYLAVPTLLAEDMGVSEALSASWDRTEQYWLSCAIVAVLAFLWQILPIAAGSLISLPNDDALWSWMLFSNALSQAGWLFGVAAATTFYLAFGNRLSKTAEIFG